MKKYLVLFKFLPLTLILIAATSCNSDDNDGPPRSGENIVELAVATPDLSILVEALQRANLTDELEASGSFTVLAPTNAAFNTFLGQNNFTSVQDVPVDALTQILLNHVIGTELSSSDLTVLQRNYAATLASGPTEGSNLSLYFDATDGVEFNGISSVVNGGADILASNGTIHIVDAVIDLPTVVTFVGEDFNFEQLTIALTSATPGTDFATILSGEGPFTVFAPVDQAFDELLDSNPDWSSLSDIDESLLTAVLQHHVVSGNNRSSGLSEGLNLTTLEGDDITVSLQVNAPFIAVITDGSGNDDVNIGFVDIQASNGVIHLIDQVMLPDTEN
ncbi:fasciclin domain-containing protein [Ulvibacterium marinum]|uniref:Fasciclin domain-containing protein n=1 Tax=Ulvibacterium marinum TaxID=2419782 RepID=A0A3B0BXA4_9FLAO|nr:fasciclin domain-containing protein [Ulvibacterium marinum]RKN78073.1 fasciclin domain-containing protein [Ulvibacterium marinum]